MLARAVVHRRFRGTCLHFFQNRKFAKQATIRDHAPILFILRIWPFQGIDHLERFIPFSSATAFSLTPPPPDLWLVSLISRLPSSLQFLNTTLFRATFFYRSDGRFWPVDLWCAAARRKSTSLRLVSMRSDTILPQEQHRRSANSIAVITTLCASPHVPFVCLSLSLVSPCKRDQLVA
jgi:hypothetical protein